MRALKFPIRVREGVCGTCRCVLTQGEVYMANNLVLDQDEVANGNILACQSFANTSEVKLKYV